MFGDGGDIDHSRLGRHAPRGRSDQFGGSIERDWHAEGLVVTISLSLERIAS
jgi:hypothetical protein